VNEILARRLLIAQAGTLAHGIGFIVERLMTAEPRPMPGTPTAAQRRVTSTSHVGFRGVRRDPPPAS
jgi:hypothetical protein